MIVWAGEPDGCRCARALGSTTLEREAARGPRRRQRPRPARGRLPPGRRARALRGARRAATPPSIRDAPRRAASLDAAFLVNADPVRDFPDGPGLERGARQGEASCSRSRCSRTRRRKHADVVFPAESYAEKEGTVTHPDGRLQRLRPGRPAPGPRAPDVGGAGRALRPARRGDRDRLGARGARRRSPPRSPSTPGITHEEIGGTGVRWQDRDAASSFRVRAAAPRAAERKCRHASARPAGGAPGAGGRRPPPRHLPRPLGRGGHRPQPRAAVPGAEADARARARGRRAARHRQRRRGRRALQRDERPGAGRDPRADAARVGLPDRGPRRRRPAPWSARTVEVSTGGRRRVSLLLADTNFVEATWILVVKSIVIFAVIFAIVPMLTVLERKLLGRFQARYGPNRVGPVGLLQPLADAVKLVTKEHYRPANAIPLLWHDRPGDRRLHRRRDAGDHPVRERQGRRRPLRDRRPDRHPLLLRLRLDRVLRPAARRLGVGLEVQLPRARCARRRS